MRCMLVALFAGVCLPVTAQVTPPQKVQLAVEALRAATPSARFARTIDLAIAYRLAEMLDSSRAVADRALRGATSDGERSRAHCAIASVLFEQDEFQSVQDEAQEAIVLAREAKDTLAWLRAEFLLSEVDMSLERFESGRTRALRIIPLAKAINDSTRLAAAINVLGNVCYLRHDLDSARWYYDRAILYMPDAEDRNRAALLFNQVNLFIEEEQYDSALARSGAMRSSIMGMDGTMIGHYYNQRGYAHFNAGRYREAVMEFLRSDSVNGARDNNLDLRIENTGFLAESYAALGDTSRAYLSMRDLEVLKDSLNRTAMDERMLQLEKQFETRLNKEEIARLDQENKQKAEHLRAKNLQLYGSLVLALFALGGALLIWRNLRQKRKHAAVLEALNTELRDQKERIEGINRLLQLKVLRTQMNPHFIYNSLNAIHNLVRKGESVAASAYLDGFARLLRMVLDHSVKDRVPLEDELEFLRQYLKLEAMRFEDGLDYSVDADRALLDDDLFVPTLIVQPFVENAVWHGLASKQGERRLRVSFAMRDGKLVCTVEDNGVGRDAAPKRSHPDGSASVGLQLTNERLQLLAYKLEGTGRITFTDLMDGVVVKGTRVEVVLSAG
ncbi:MAG: histidine kinase [Flavobacteriales bacterium]